MRMLATVSMAAAGLALAAAALAQGTGSPAPAPVPGAAKQAAPVGHRQPRAADVPAAPADATRKEGASADQTDDKRDAALDRALRSICRGC